MVGDTAKSQLDPSLRDIILADQLLTEQWSEGFVVRPNGDYLFTQMQAAELRLVDAASIKASADGVDQVESRVVHTFENANSLCDICRLSLSSSREEYAVCAANGEIENPGSYNNWVIWRVAFSLSGDVDKPEVTKIAEVVEARSLIGLEQVSRGILMVVDCILGCVMRVELDTGKRSIFIKDELMLSDGTGFYGFMGIRRLQFTEKYAWFINMSNGTLCRFPLARTTDGQDIEVLGPAEMILGGLNHPDGFVMRRDGSAGYVCTCDIGELLRVDTEGLGGARKATVTTLRSDLVFPTAMDLVYGGDGQAPTLYIACNGEMPQGDDSSGLEVTITNSISIVPG